MRHVDLIVFQDSPTGETGLKLKDAPTSDTMYAAREGILIAHDLLEHQNGPADIGDIGDELEALGAIWYVRGEYGDITRRPNVNTPHQHVASDVDDMLRKVAEDPSLMPYCRRTRACVVDEDLQDICRIGEETARKEWNYNNEEPMPRGLIDEYMRAALGRMRIGYRKAARRFKDQRAANRLFWNVVAAIDRTIKGAELHEGALFRLSYDIGTGRAFCEEHYEEDI